MMNALSTELTAKRDALVEMIRDYGSCAVAFSAGIDSTVVAKAAQLALGPAAVAVTGVSDSLAGGELDEARRLAALIGIRHEVIRTEEFQRPEYLRNAPDRCYHCKTELYTQLEGVAERLGVAVLLNGANVDDQGDYRPGMIAAGEHRVRSPLIECGLNKAEIRQLAAAWELPIWDKPASPCLSSRIAYGEEVTPERVAMIDRAEQYLRTLGLRELRVRYHKGDLARIEVPQDALSRLCQPAVQQDLLTHLKSLGFRYITLDLEGLPLRQHEPSAAGGELEDAPDVNNSATKWRKENFCMATGSRRDDMLGAIGVIILLIGTATGNAYAMLGMSVTALTVLAVFYRRQIGSGALLVAFVAAVTAAVIGIVVAIR